MSKRDACTGHAGDVAVGPCRPSYATTVVMPSRPKSIPWYAADCRERSLASEEEAVLGALRGLDARLGAEGVDAGAALPSATVVAAPFPVDPAAHVTRRASSPSRRSIFPAPLPADRAPRALPEAAGCMTLWSARMMPAQSSQSATDMPVSSMGQWPLSGRTKRLALGIMRCKRAPANRGLEVVLPTCTMPRSKGCSTISPVDDAAHQVSCGQSGFDPSMSQQSCARPSQGLVKAGLPKSSASNKAPAQRKQPALHFTFLQGRKQTVLC
jgi:hypothetical protein